jgi:hypothetical protein
MCSERLVANQRRCGPERLRRIFRTNPPSAGKRSALAASRRGTDMASPLERQPDNE